MAGSVNMSGLATASEEVASMVVADFMGVGAVTAADIGNSQ